MFQLKLGPSHICQFSKDPMCCKKFLKNNKHNSLALRTDNVGGQIYEYLFAPIEAKPQH